MRDGEPVYLCWKAGEPAVAHWHGIDEGFVTASPSRLVRAKPLASGSLAGGRVRFDRNEILGEPLQPHVAELGRVRAALDAR